MAVSIWTQNRDQIITRALLKLRVVSPGDTPTAEQVSSAADVLNAIVKSLQGEGIRLWTVEHVAKTFADSTVVLGSDGFDYLCIHSHTSSASDQPLSGANWSSFWRKLNTSTGSAWAISTAYSSIGDFTVEADTIGIEKAFVRYNETDYPVELIGKLSYAEIQNKWRQGRPTSLWLDMQSTPQAFLYPHPEDTSYVLHYLRVRRLYDYVNAGDTSDFPVRWIESLVALLAAGLSDDYAIPLSERVFLEEKAERLKARAKRDDTERSDREFTEPAYR